MIPTRFINGQDESICYVNLPFKVIFFNIFFRELIMNTNCDKIIENLDNSEDDYRNYIQKIVILQVIKHIFCVILIGGGKIVYIDSFFEVNNIRKCFQNDYSKFEGLLHKTALKKPFMSQEICYINAIL